MTTLVRLTIAAVMALFASSCVFTTNFGTGKAGNGVVVEETRKVNDEFTEVAASEGLDVYVNQGDEFSIKIEADENIIDLIGTDINDGKLRIHAIENIGRATKNVHVTLPEITKLKSSSGADLHVESSISAGKIELDASSGSDLYVDLAAEGIDADASSGAQIKISGKTDYLSVEASSGADIRASELASNQCSASASSGAFIKINVSESLTANASSGADISYTGDATVTTSKSISGNVSKY